MELKAKTRFVLAKHIKKYKEKKMKRFLSFILVFVFCLSLASCSGGNSGNGGAKEIPAELSTEKITVEFWHAMGTANQALIAKIIDNFEREYKAQGYNIEVVQTSLGDYTTLRDTISSSIAAGTQPTVAQTYPDHVALYIGGRAMQELDSYNESKWGLGEEQAQYVDGFFAEGKIYDDKGTLYSLPFNKSTEVLYYNKTIFDKYGWKVPTTWEDIVDVSTKFLETTEYATAVANKGKAAGFSYDSEANLFITLTQQWGGEYTGFNNTTGNGTNLGNGYALFDNAQSKAAVKFYYENFKAGKLVTTTYFGTNYSSDAFKAGQCIMTLGSSAGASYNVPTDESFEVGVAPYPQKAGFTNGQVIQQGTNVSLFKTKDAQKELAGWLFMKYLTNYESAMIWVTGYDEYTNIDGESIEAAVGTSYFPIRKDVLNSEKYNDYISGKIEAEDGSVIYEPTTQNLAAQVGLQQAGWFYTNVAFEGSSSVRDEAELLVQAILYGDNSGFASDDEVINNAYEVAIRKLKYA